MRPSASTADISDLRREVRKLLDPVLLSIRTNADEITSLKTAVTTVTAIGAYAEIVNLLPNSHPEWSKDAYTTLAILPGTAGDGNLEAYNWYRQPVADTELVASVANALKATGHSLFTANEIATPDIPRWDKVNGIVEFGGAAARYDIVIPLSNDLVFPGQIFYVQFEAMLRTTTALPSIQAYCGIYDNSATQRKYIEGGSFTITDDAGGNPGVTFGVAGTTSVDYKVIAFTDSGEQAESNILNFPNAPSVFTGNNHPRVKFAGVPGFIKFEIYRKIAGTTVLQYIVGNTIEGTYLDIGNPPLRTVSDFPVVTQTKPRAYALTSTFQSGSITGIGWIRNAMTIFVPTTYNRSVTGTGMQYFRFGFTGLTTEARQVQLRRFGLSMGSGKWARSADDARTGAHSTPSSTAAYAGSSGSGGVEPPPGGGGGGCALLESDLSLIEGTKQLGTAIRGDLVDTGGPVCGRIQNFRMAQTGRIFRVTTESGQKMGCTFDHPYITSQTDINGTACEMLKSRLDAGEDVFTLTRPDKKIISDRITSIEVEFGDFWVGIPTIEGPPLLMINKFLCHNKPPLNP